MSSRSFRDRRDAARQLAERLRQHELHEPLVLGIPRGGVVTAAMLAQELEADMDIALSRKLRHPRQPELAIGAISEDGDVYLQDRFRESMFEQNYLQQEKDQRLQELRQRQQRFRDIRPAAPIAGRSIILTDDGIATGSTMFAALHLVKAKDPREIIVAVPVAPPSRLEQFRQEGAETVTVMAPENFMAIGQFYEDFEQIDDEQVCEALRPFADSPSQQ